MARKRVELVASPGELVCKVSDLLGISEPTIVQHDRNLVVAGLRSKSGRGTSAARVTPRDAARLLVAVLGSHHVKDSVQTVRRYSETRLHKTLSQGYADTHVAALMNLQPGHSFVDGLEALIAAAAEGCFNVRFMRPSRVRGEEDRLSPDYRDHCSDPATYRGSFD